MSNLLFLSLALFFYFSTLFSSFVIAAYWWLYVSYSHFPRSISSSSLLKFKKRKYFWLFTLYEWLLVLLLTTILMFCPSWRGYFIFYSNRKKYVGPLTVRTLRLLYFNIYYTCWLLYWKNNIWYSNTNIKHII